MLTVTLKSKPNDTSTVTVSYAGEHLVYAFPHDSPSESVTRACGFAEFVGRASQPWDRPQWIGDGVRVCASSRLSQAGPLTWRASCT